MRFKQYLIIEQKDMNKETVQKLFKSLDKAAMKKVSKLPNTAPIVKQVIQSIGEVQQRLKPSMNLKGEEAVKAFFGACKGLFLANQPPLSTLIKKYPQLTQQINNVFLDDEMIF
jgi:hypothetical protein